MDGEDGSSLYKVLVVGKGGVGKTCIIRQYVANIFQANTKSTIGVDFALKNLQLDGHNVTLQIWDVAGQERYGQMTRVYYQAAVGAFVVFDIQKPESFNEVPKWKQDIDSKVFLPNNEPIPVILVANKSDLGPLSNFMSNEEMDEFCKRHSFVGWVEASAKEDVGVAPAFRQLVESVLRNDATAAPSRVLKHERNVVLTKDRTANEKNRCSC